MEETITAVATPLFRDPIYDGASDPVVIWNQEEHCFFMFYTQRRATSVQVGFSSIHGSKIGVASSRDGAKWLYRGTLPNLDFEPGHNTFWAPEVIFAQGQYHMYVSYITGIPTDWNYERKILHYTAKNLWSWTYQGEIELSSKRVIDACIYEVEPNIFKMWYKDESNHSHSYAAISHDLFNWEVLGAEITDCAHEGPNVFELGNIKWMITDFWKGLGVYRSEDFIHWNRCEKVLLSKDGKRSMDQGLGHHGDIVVVGDEAYLFYFCHPFDSSENKDNERVLTAIQVVRIWTDGETLHCDRDEVFQLQLSLGIKE